jgi:hypothetical protein
MGRWGVGGGGVNRRRQRPGRQGAIVTAPNPNPRHLAFVGSPLVPNVSHIVMQGLVAGKEAGLGGKGGEHRLDGRYTWACVPMWVDGEGGKGDDWPSSSPRGACVHTWCPGVE